MAKCPFYSAKENTGCCQVALGWKPGDLPHTLCVSEEYDCCPVFLAQVLRASVSMPQGSRAHNLALK